MRAYIDVYMPDEQAQRFELSKKTITIGRSPKVDVCLDDPKISRGHARIWQTESNRWAVEDLSSRNRTFLNNRPIKSHVLSNNDTFYVSDIRIVFCDPTGLSDEPADQTIYNDHAQAETDSAEKLSNIDISGTVVIDSENLSDQAPETHSQHKSSEVKPISAIIANSQRPAVSIEQGNILDESMGLFSQHRPVGQANPLTLSKLLIYKWTMVAVFVLLATPAIVATWTLVAPKYTARGEIRVRPILPHLVFQTEDSGTIPFYTSYVNTQVAVMRNPTILRRVLDQPNVQNTQWYKKPEASLIRNPLPPLERLGDYLSVRPRGRTEIIDVAMTTRKASDSAVIVNAVLDQYIKFVRESTEQTKDFLFRTLVDEYNSRGNEIEGR